jgi:uncharacterized protein YcfJ
MNTMRKTLTLAAMAAIVALPMLAASSDADASCRGRKDTGTALGAIGGALIGNSVSKGGGGAIVGGLGGAVVGHELAKGGCSSGRSYYRHSRSRYARDSRYDNRGYDSRAYDSRAYNSGGGRTVYYDRQGNPVPTAYNYPR